MKELLHHLATQGPLSRDQAVDAFTRIMTPPPDGATPAQIGALLAMIATRAPTVDELVGAATVMRQKVTRVETPDGMTIIDTCGVGGTSSTFFNISTTAAIVVAAAGRPHNVGVAKHGNRAITSRSGSAQVLQSLGVNLQVPPEALTRCLDEVGICFCFAPAHHPAMKYAAPVRQELGIRTIFNLLGPLTNPAGALRQLIGVPTAELTQTFASVLRELGADHAMIVHSTLPDGRPLGELTNFGPSVAHELNHGMIKSIVIDPANLGVPFALPESVSVKDADDSARMVRKVLAGEAGAARDIVRLNAAAALIVAGLVRNMSDGVDMATDAIDSGAARQTLDALVTLTREAQSAT
jgi:anthranilate phosphoribosyltransferase